MKPRTNIFTHETWKRMDIVPPKDDFGIVLKIVSDREDEYDMHGHLLYGTKIGNKVNIIYDLTTDSSMSWKAHKDYDLNEMYWLYSCSFARDYELPDINETSMLAEYGKFVQITTKEQE